MPSPAPKRMQEIQEIPLKMVGGVNYGRYPKISVENTFNMIVSDDALVPYAGYKNVLTQSPGTEGRGIYSSSRGNIMIAVWGRGVYSINSGLVATPIGNLGTSTGDVFITENNNGEIAITDYVHIYVYNWFAPTFPLLKVSGTDFSVPAALTNPGYISFQNGRMIVANANSQNWYLSGANAATTWTGAANTVGALQSKPDTIQAAVPTPGGGNVIYIFGHNVIEQWQDVGAALFPYQRSSTFNVDYGTVNPSSIAALGDYVVWLSANEQSGVTLMMIEGGRVQSISTEGIDYKLANLTNPTNCTGFLFRQDGHTIYQFTFPDDNLSFALDFKTKLFSTVTDENLDYHIARSVVFFNNQYYFVSMKGGNLFDFSTQFTNFDYGDDDIQEIPQIRICPPVRLPSQRMFITKSIGFTIENGQKNPFLFPGDYLLCTEDLDNICTESLSNLELKDNPVATGLTECVDLSMSRDGGESFGTSWRQWMNPTGQRKSRFIWQQCGQANDASYQFRFSGYGRFVVFDGQIEVYT